MFRKNFTIIIYILVLITNSLITKYLSNQGLDGSFILFNRGLICLLFVILAALLTKQNLKPQKLGIQIIRFFVAGIGLFCITNSFKFINATSVSLVQRLEILMVVIATSVISKSFFTIKNIYAFAVFVAAGVFRF
jgi:drug/metabolite transporter (DMT)-like permease